MTNFERGTSLGPIVIAERKRWQIVLAPALITAVAVLYWFWPPRSPGVDPAVLINVSMTTAMALSGMLLWAQIEGAFRSIRWIRHAWVRVIHEFIGLVYFPIILLVDFYETADGQMIGEPVFLEGLNKPVMIVTMATAAFLYFKWPRSLLTYYRPIRYVHIAVAGLWVVKFFLEPLYGGQLG